MLDGSLDQGSVICLGYAYFFSIPESGYAYKCYAYKKKHDITRKILSDKSTVTVILTIKIYSLPHISRVFTRTSIT